MFGKCEERAIEEACQGQSEDKRALVSMGLFPEKFLAVLGDYCATPHPRSVWIWD